MSHVSRHELYRFATRINKTANLSKMKTEKVFFDIVIKKYRKYDMKIFVLGSMQFSEQMVEARDKLRQRGHQAVTSVFVDAFVGKTDEEKEVIKIDQKNNQDAMKVDCAQVVDQDAILVMNLDKHEIPNYIGGNVLIEMGYAHILNKQIYLYNPIPDIAYYKTEIEAMKPIIINGNLNQISL